MDDKRPDNPEMDNFNPEIIEQFEYLEKTGIIEGLERLRKENKYLDTLINDSMALFGKDDIADMIDFTISCLLERFIPTYLVFLVEPPNEEQPVQYCYKNLQRIGNTFPDRYYELLKSFFQNTQSPATFADIEEKMGSELFEDDFRIFEPSLIFPMPGIGGIYGIVLLGKKVIDGEYSDFEWMTASRIIRFLSAGIQNKLHHISSITDVKTRLYNHRYFLGRLKQEISRISRHSGNAGLIMLDIDHFKHFNDTWGHLAGDEVLKLISDTIKRIIRSEDVASRFGGEEFCILLVDCDEKNLFDIAERLRLAVRKIRISVKGENPGITASFGCVLLNRNLDGDMEMIIEKADNALYSAKKSGRDCTVVYKPSLLHKAGLLNKKF